MDVKGYFHGLASRFQSIFLAQGLVFKIDVAVFQTMRSVPNTFLKRSRRLKNFIRSDIPKCLNARFAMLPLEHNGIIFVAADVGSLTLVDPMHEFWMPKYLKPKKGEIGLDIGANVGKYTLTWARNVGPKGQVIAIEPFPDTFRALKDGIRLNGFQNVRTFNVAAWNEKAILNMYITPYAGTHSVVENSDMGHIQVRARTIDSIVQELALPFLDFVKIDVEGAELNVLEGMKETIGKYRPRMVVEVRSYNNDGFLAFIEALGCYRTNVVKETAKGSTDCYYQLVPTEDSE